MNIIALKLRNEMKDQIDHVELVKATLADEKSLFSEDASKNLVVLVFCPFFTIHRISAGRMIRFLQVCIYPRVVLSEVDALYCVKFIETLHLSRTPCFQTIVLFDKVSLFEFGGVLALAKLTITFKVFNNISPILRSLTDKEAHCYGVFLRLLLAMLNRWRSPEVFDVVGYWRLSSTHTGN